MNRILTAACICILSILISCQRPVDEVIEPAPPPPPEEARDSTLLRRMWQFDDGTPVGVDTISGYYFKYDDQKRPLEMIAREQDQIAGYDYIYTLKYHYRGAEQLAYLVTRVNTSITESQWDGTDSMFLVYENGLVAQDSTISYFKGSNTPWIRAINTNRTVGDTLYNHYREYYRDIDGQDAVRDTIYPVKIIRSNGNLVEFTCPKGPEHFYNINRFNDHPNPQYRFYIPFPYEYHLYEWGDVAYKNLPVYLGVGSERLSANPDRWAYQELSYEYRADGYPLTVTIDDSFDDNYKIRYVYY